MEDKQKVTESKESLDSSLEYADNDPTKDQPPLQPTTNLKPPSKNPLSYITEKFSGHWTIYLPIFILLAIGVIVAMILLYQHQNSSQPSIAQQTLTPKQLNNLANSNDVIGSANQVLTVQSSSIFNGQVLVKGQLQVAKGMQINQLTVNNDLSVSNNLLTGGNLSVTGNESVQGTLTLQKGLSVNGSGAFSGSISSPQVTTSSLQLNGDLTLNHHLIAIGSIPGRLTGSATGVGGTTSVNGSDTAGTVTINTGGSPTAGCYITVNFTSPFGSTPAVMLTPVGPGSASLSYYVNRSGSSFSVCSASTPQSGQTYVFDYFVIE